MSQTQVDVVEHTPPVICEDGVFYTWLPTYNNPAHVVLHRWSVDLDAWIETDVNQMLPSRRFGTNGKPN